MVKYQNNSKENNMKKCLAFYANPNFKSFTSQILLKFLDGLDSTGLYEHETVNVYLTAREGEGPRWKEDIEEIKEQIKAADLIVFAFPLWWEMPPAALVDLLQTIFVKDFAYTHEGGVKTNLLDVNVINLISMGREQPFDTTNLSEAMRYCGLKPQHCIFTKIGPGLTSQLAETYLDLAYQLGKKA
jgi:putative NADPH-quinone reductase